MSINIDKASCAKLVEDIDGNKSWTTPESGKMLLNENNLKYEGNTIPYTSINNAILNREKIPFSQSHYSLLIETAHDSYLFNFDSPELWDAPPFNLQKTEGGLIDIKSLLKPSMYLVALMVIVLLLDLIL